VNMRKEDLRALAQEFLDKLDVGASCEVESRLCRAMMENPKQALVVEDKVIAVVKADDDVYLSVWDVEV